MSASAFDILYSDLGYRDPPAPLRVRSVGATEADRRDIRAAVYENLAERGLFHAGELDAALRERLRVLARSSVYVECEALLDLEQEEPLRAVAATTGRRGVLAVQPNRTIALAEIGGGSEVFAAAVGVLPPLSPGPGLGVSLPASVFGVDGEVDDPVYGDAESGRSAAQQRQLREVLAIQARPVLGAGQFSVRVREEAGSRRLGGVSWFSTDIGAYLGTTTEGRAGRQWVNVAPADRERIAARLAELP
ncbi:hypothetical protein FHU38_003142 [Saccharomonospora amisosensis]|uniref:EspG family protein n=1 Tax=Saccharomonospora amisosensis TaxID=1128677 RepID=A0A7X5URB8_9PSEU|nr:hypothetical protein [Saccharomonospora amisosensis]